MGRAHPRRAVKECESGAGVWGGGRAGKERGAPGPRGPREAEAWAGGRRRGRHAESRRIDPPAASRGGGDSGPGRGGRSCPLRQGTARRRRAGQGPGEAGRGARVAVRGRRAEGTRAPRNAGRPGLRRPCPATAAAPAGSPRGAAGRRALVGVLRSRSVGPREVPGSWRPGGRQSEGCRRGLFKWCQASPGLFSLHHPATPAMRRNLKAGKESSVSPAPLFNRWRDSSGLHRVTFSRNRSPWFCVRETRGEWLTEARVRPVWLEMQVWLWWSFVHLHSCRRY